MTDNLIVKRSGNAFLFRWQKELAEAKLSRIKEHSSGAVTGELLFRSLAPGGEGHLHQAQINLLSTATRQKYAQQLQSRRNDADWMSLVEQVCVLALADIRQGEPVKLITATQAIEDEQYILSPIAPLGNPTILFGEGGTAKSHIALICGLIVDSAWGDNPLCLMPEHQHPRKTLYLDWEMTERDFRRRLHLVAQGCNLPDAALNYRECRASLADDQERIMECVAEIGAEFVIIDSVAGAAGGDINTAETALRFFGALRQLRCTSLVIAHTSKNQETKKKTPFGSVFFWNYARSIWEVVGHQEEGGLTVDVGMFHRKSNVSGLSKPLGFKFTFQEGATLIKESSIKDIPAIAERMSAKAKILAYLKNGMANKKDIAEVINETPKITGSRLSELKTSGCVVLLPGDNWGLSAKDYD